MGPSVFKGMVLRGGAQLGVGVRLSSAVLTSVGMKHVTVPVLKGVHIIPSCGGLITIRHWHALPCRIRAEGDIILPDRCNVVPDKEKSNK